jgi:hypothetical protein
MLEMPDLPDIPSAAAAVSGAWATRRILAPTLDKMGEQLRDRYSDFSSRNILGIITRTEKRLGSSKGDQQEFSPRVLLKVLDEGAYCNAPVMAEYFAGILAGSRSPGGIDDRGTSWAGFVSRLATSDISLHYICFDAFRSLYAGETDLNLGLDTDRGMNRTGVYVPGSDLCLAMGTENSVQGWNEVIMPSIATLVREGLLGLSWTVGDLEQLDKRHHIKPSESGFVFHVDLPGLHLFNWAHGKPYASVNSILDTSEKYEVDTDIPHLSRALRLDALRN